MRAVLVMVAALVLVPPLVAPTAVAAQTLNRPMPVAPGMQFTVPATSDTVFVLPLHMYKNALRAALEIDLADSMIVTLEAKTDLLELIIGEQQDIIDIRTEGYVRYRDLWLETDKKLEEQEVEAEKLKSSRLVWSLVTGAVVGVVVALAAAN